MSREVPPNRWRHISHLYHAALAREGDRAAFLEQACAGDEALRREVESLLAEPASAAAFLAEPAVALAAQLVGDPGASMLTGRRIGVYQVQALLGAGGMGEVYRARDTKLGRDVAIKILPGHFTSDPERLARFEREARMLAALNHPHIAAIYGFEDADGGPALVLELVDGPTLADRLANGPVPIAEALQIGRQIADALEAAHEKGIVHRDLKPANIKITRDGVVKVLDFGLAKASAGTGPTPDLTQAPMATIDRTREGIVLGTPAYMSPEQARGHTVDKRADIWAFGCVMYEMLTGRATFAGKTISDTIAAILERDPDWGVLPRTVPSNVQRLLHRCLEKDPKKRLRDIGDIGLVLDGEPSRAITRTTWLWPAAVLFVLLVASALGFIYFREVPATRQSLRFQVPVPGRQTPAQMFALSPDGRYLAFVAADDGPTRLWVRAMDAVDSRPLAGTDGATYPFWSPDSQYLGFFAQGELKKTALTAGSPQTLCDATNGRGGSWNSDGVIIFSPAPSSPILKVSSAGGEPTPLTELAPGEGHRFPAFLPDGQHFLYTAAGGLFVGSLSRTAPVQLLSDATMGLYAPSADRAGSGFLLFLRESTLMAQPFNPSRVGATGEAFPIAEQVILASPSIGSGAFSVSANGTVAFRTAGVRPNRQLIWVDRTGRRLAAGGDRAAISDLFSLAPDGKTVALTINTTAVDAKSGGNADIWLQNEERGVRTRFTLGGGVFGGPVWSPDGDRVAFSLLAANQYSATIHQQSVVGNRQEELLRETGGVGATATDWSTDGAFIVFQWIAPKTGGDLWLLPLDPGSKPFPYLQTAFDERNAHFAPSSGSARWMAYQSNESGEWQIYIQSIPTGGPKFRISTAGGVVPQWRKDGTELYFMGPKSETLGLRPVGGRVVTDPDGGPGYQQLMAVSIDLSGDTPRMGAPKELFTTTNATSFVPSADGQRFLVNVAADQGAADAGTITVLTNWQTSLQK